MTATPLAAWAREELAWLRDDLAAELGGLQVAPYERVQLRLATLERELPELAALCAEMTWWRGGVPDSRCVFAMAYRRALIEHNDLGAELLAMAVFLVAD